MTDPLSVLNAEDPPVQPNPEFAARLRQRLESALSLPPGTQGVEMSGTTTALAELTDDAPATVERPRPAALPYLTVGDARAAIAWYRDALGAELLGDPILMDDGRIGHAELALGDGVLYLADEFADMGLRAPAPGWTSVSLMVHVPDTDVALNRARRQGATVEREPYQAHGSRAATIRDPFGHRWMISGPLAELIGPGDIGYLSVQTPDVQRARAFYGQVLGWTFDADDTVTNTVERIGLSRGMSTLVCCYAVTDLAAAQSAITGTGGRVEGRAASIPATASTPPTRRACHSRCTSPTLPSAGRRSTARAPGNCPTSPTKSATRRCSVISSPGCSAGRSSPAGSPTAGRSTRPGRWPVWRAGPRGSRWCRCGRWPTSRRPWHESARPAAPCSPTRRSSPTG